MKNAKEYRKQFTEKALKIVDSMSLEEKVHLMSGTISMEELLKQFNQEGGLHYNYVPYPAGGDESRGVPPMLFCDGPRGVVCGSGTSTCFPVTMLRGASFDDGLEEKIGHAIGQEVRFHGGNLYAGVCINLPYHPGWGRSQESYGEESFALGKMGSALVRGVQGEGVMACVKHFAFNSMELSRFQCSVDCERRTEREVFLPHFKDCIDAGAASIMSAYNLYKGIHCGHSDYLLRKVLKEEWDFDGFVMSDFAWGVRDTVEAANGGQDMEMCCTQYFGKPLVQAVRDGLVPERRIDEAALRIVRTILSFQALMQENPAPGKGACPEHAALALKSAQEGITLLQNRENVLPFDRKTVKKLLILGKLGNCENIGDHGSSRVFPAHVSTPVEGISVCAPETEVTYCDGKNPEYAKKLAKEADAVIIVAGFNYDDEGEFVAADQGSGMLKDVGGDRATLALHEDEAELIRAVGPVNRNSAVVLIGGNTITMEDWMDSVNGILMAYYPGEAGGDAMAQILFGDVNPSGKLPFVVPHSEKDLPGVNWKTTSQYYEYYHGYAKLEKEGVAPLLPYGFGLSYTSFAFSDGKAWADGDVLRAECTVSNTGKRAGCEVAQLYVGFRNSAVDRPVKLLRGFSRVELEPGESRRVRLECPLEKLKWYNPNTAAWELEKMEYEVYLGSSSADSDLLRTSVTL